MCVCVYLCVVCVKAGQWWCEVDEYWLGATLRVGSTVSRSQMNTEVSRTDFD